MPIILDDLQKGVPAQQVKTWSPKFFDSKLTGRGGSTAGLLSAHNNPMAVAPMATTDPHDAETIRRVFRSGQTTVNKIPMNPLTVAAWQLMDVIKRPDVADMVRVAYDTNGNSVYLIMEPQAIILEETVIPDRNGGPSTTKKEFTANYACTFFIVHDMNKTEHSRDSYANYQHFVRGNSYWMHYSSNPLQELQFDVMPNFKKGGWTVDNHLLLDYLLNYDIYDAVCLRSELWQTKIDGVLDAFFTNVSKRHKGDLFAQRAVQDMVKYIMSYNIPLDLYKSIYASIVRNFPPDEAKIICKQNLNLLLSDTLGNLDANKSQITGFTPNAAGSPVPASVSRLSPEQMKAVTSTEPLILVQAGAGTGKALSVDTPILTPTGWTTMGELKVGNLVVGSDGKPHTVLRIHEQGLKPGYELTFRDGSSVRCCGEHLWTVCNQSRNGEQYRTLTTEEWLNGTYRTHAYLPMVKPIEYAYGEKDLPIDPYLLGALLADGCLVENSIQYTKSEQAVVDEVRKAAARDGYDMHNCTCETSTACQWRFSHPNDQHHANILKSRIRELGLIIKSRDKFVPEEYKTASIAQRKALLNGLFDGDGDIRTGRGYARLNTASDRLADDVLQLLWSLGLAATKQRQRNKKGDYWSVNLLDSSWDPFVASGYAGKPAGSVRPMRRSIKSAVPIEPTPMRCIEIDAPDKLYVTKDFIVTHNSTLILGRIDYLVDAGVNPGDITVLSFTNAAADHITAKNPNVHSMTIARMIHEIYTANFKDHELSSLDTIINSLDIYYPPQPGVLNGIVPDFQRRLKAMVKGDTNNFTEMNNFIEDHYDEVMDVLDTIHQTSLELEIIICYQKIDTLVEPASIASKFLIIDEVQDNSIFEFVYTLKYIDKHKESLFIVGKLRLPTLNPTNCGNATRCE